MSRGRTPSAAEQVVAAWTEMHQLATAPGHHFGEYHDIVLEIARLPESYAIAFTPGNHDTSKAINAKVLLSETSRIALAIYAVESKHDIQRDFFTRNAELWTLGLESSMFIKLGTHQAELETLGDAKFGKRPAHPPIADGAGFAYALLRSFLSKLLAVGNFRAFSQIAEKSPRWSLPRRQLLSGLETDENRRKAHVAITACLRQAQRYCEKLNPAAAESKDGDEPVSRVEEPAAAAAAAGADEEKPPSAHSVSGTHWVDFSDEETDGDDSDDEKAKAEALSASRFRLHAPPRGSLLGTATRLGPTIKKSSLDAIKLAQAQWLLKEILGYLSTRKKVETSLVGYYVGYYTTDDYTQREKCFQHIRLWVQDPSITDEQSTEFSASMRTWIVKFQGYFPYLSSQNFHDHVTKLCNALELKTIQMSHLREALTRLDAEAESSAVSLRR